MSKIIPLENHENGYVTLKFNCPNCNVSVMSDILPLPHVILNLNDKTSQNIYYTCESCLFCGKDYKITIVSKNDKTQLEIDSIPEDYDVTVLEAESDKDFIKNHIETFLYDTDTMRVFRTEIQKLKDLLDLKISDEDLHKTLLKQIYSGIITCLEDYLSTTLIKEVLNNKRSFKNFVKHDLEISKRNFKIHDIINDDFIENVVKERLLSIMYHNLGVIKHLYKIIFHFDIPEFKKIAKIINNRHHMVHRNGKNLEGEVIIIDKNTVKKAILSVENFIQEIDQTITVI